MAVDSSEGGGPFGNVKTGRYRALWWLAVPYAGILVYAVIETALHGVHAVDHLLWFWGLTLALVIVVLAFVQLGARTRAQRRALTQLRPGAAIVLCAPSEAMETGLRGGGYLTGPIPPAVFATLDAANLELWPRVEKAPTAFARVPLADIAGVRADSVRVDASRYSGGANTYDWRAIVVVLKSGGTIPLALYRPGGTGIASVAQANALIAEFTPRLPLLP